MQCRVSLVVLVVDLRNLLLKFDQNWVSNSLDIADIEFLMLWVGGGVGYRDRKSVVSWYPCYQPISDLAANFGWDDGFASHQFESKQPIRGWIEDMRNLQEKQTDNKSNAIHNRTTICE